MAEKQLARPKTIDTETDVDLVAADYEKMVENGNRLPMVDRQYGDQLPYDKQRLIGEIRALGSRAAEVMLEIGKRLILIKEHEPHGEFIEALKNIGIGERTARRLMSVTIRYQSPKMSHVLSLGQSKAIELLVEDDEGLEALAEGGTVAGLTLDDIDRMSVSELRKTLRAERKKAKENQEIQDKILSDKNKKIDELDKKLHGINSKTTYKPWDHRIEMITNDLARAGNGADALLAQLVNVLDAATNLCDEVDTQDGGQQMQYAITARISEMLERLCNSVGRLRSQYGQYLWRYSEQISYPIDFDDQSN